MKVVRYLACIFIISICSCSPENEISSNSNARDVEILDGRLHFRSMSEFVTLYKKMADEEDDKLSEYFNPLYHKGFYSLRPIVTEANESFLYEHYKSKIPTSHRMARSASEDDGEDGPLDDIDDLEELIGDDAFAAFLNDKGEIQIEDIIYKYTDVGLFFSKIDKLDVLKEYLETKQISDDPLISTLDTPKEMFYLENPNNGLTMIDQIISYYKMQPEAETPTVPGDDHYEQLVDVPSFEDFVKNLQECHPSSGLFGNIFGVNRVCKDKYESRRRVKTKAFSYDYFFIYHMGVKVKHQYRGWTGFWRTEAAPEMRLVCEAIQFEYDPDQLLNNALINNSNNEKYFYTQNQKIHYGPNNIQFGGWGYTFEYFNQNSLPEVFQDGLTIEFFSTGWDYLDNLIDDGLNSALNANRLNQYFYNGLYDSVSNELGDAFGAPYAPPLNRTFISKFPENGKVIVQKSYVSVGYNVGVRKKTFDWGLEVSFTASENGNNWNISGGAGDQLLRPKHFRAKLIGAARTNAWHGSKLSTGF